MTKHKDKYLLVVSFLEARNFAYRADTKLIIEAKFDGEQLVTDPVDHTESIEINQELAWELDKKSLQQYKIQYGAIKVNCYAVSGETVRENIGYVVLNIRSAPEGQGKPAWHPLLQSKYPKLKPAIQINMYVEGDNSDSTGHQEAEPTAAIENVIDDQQDSSVDFAADHHHLNINSHHLRPSPALTRTLSANNSVVSDNGGQAGAAARLKVTLVPDKSYFLIGQASQAAQTYILTITVSFARHLIRLLPVNASSARSFFFTFTFLENQVTTKPFGDIVSCSMSGENSVIRLHASFDNLKRFFVQENELTFSFCSEDRLLGRASLSWKSMVNKWTEENITYGLNDAFVMDYLLKFEPADTSLVRASPSIEATQAPVLGVQIGLTRESLTHSGASAGAETSTLNAVRPRSHASTPNHLVEMVRHEENNYAHHHSHQHQQAVLNDQVPEHEYHDPAPPATHPHHTKQVHHLSQQQQQHQRVADALAFVTEEMQLKVAYELQVWKEAREKEFELNLKKQEAKRFQALAEAFKQHDIERELLVQKKLKEYNDLEIVLKNSLNEVEKREKQLALGETQIARLKADLHHEHENKLLELREASKRVQEKADHQVALQKNKIDNLEDEIARYKRQIIEWEKKYADKEAEFARYKERETNRPEIRLQSEINMLNLERVELERKLEAMCKAKEHYKERWARALQEIGVIKKREEESGKALLKKQQLELEQLKLKFLAAEESESIKSDERQIQSIKHELERLKQNSHRSHSNEPNDLRSAMSTLSMSDVEPALREHINRLIDERETFLRTGVYSCSDGIIVELDKRIAECLRRAKSQQQSHYYQMNPVSS